MGLRVLALVCLASGNLGRSAIVPEDELSLLQFHNSPQHLLIHSAEFYSTAMALADLALHIRGGLARLIPEVLPEASLGNVSTIGGFTMEETMSVGMEVLSYFAHNETVEAIYTGIRNLSTAMGNQSVNLGLRARELYRKTKDPDTMNISGVFDELEAFARVNLEEIAEYSAGSLNGFARMLRSAPDGPSSFLKNMSSSMLDDLLNITKDDVFAGIFWPPTFKLLKNRTYFCGNFNPVYWHIVDLDQVLSMLSRDYVPRAMELMPGIRNTVSAFAPGMASEILEFVNVTLENFDEIVSGYNISIHLVMEVLWEVGTNRLGCHFVRPEPEENAAVRPGLFLVTSACLAAWFWRES